MLLHSKPRLGCGQGGPRMCGPSGRFIAELDSGSPPHPYIFSSLPSPVFCQETPSSSRAAKQRLRSRVTGGGLCILKPRRLSNFIKVTCWVPAWGGGRGTRGGAQTGCGAQEWEGLARLGTGSPRPFSSRDARQKHSHFPVSSP